jgi:hypothetical protein
VDPKVDLYNVEKRKFLSLPGLELQPLSRPACSQSLYRLLYPGSSLKIIPFKYFTYTNIFKHNATLCNIVRDPVTVSRDLTKEDPVVSGGTQQ